MSHNFRCVRKQGEMLWVFTQMHDSCLVQNRLKVKVNPFTLFWGPFFQSQFFHNYTSNEAQTKLKTIISIYIHPGEYIWLFAWANIYTVIRPGEYIWLFARANIYSYSPGRIYIWLFARANIYMVIRPGE